jgi:hypothetical protein
MSGSDQVVAALARLHQFQAPSARKGGGAPLSIGVTRQAGSRGPEIARAVGDLLGWPVYDHEILSLIAKDAGMSEQLLEHLDERYVSWVEEMAASFSVHTNPPEGTYIKRLLTVLGSLARVGHCVLVGRGAPLVLPVDSTLRVRLIAPRAVRVAHTARRMGVSMAEAERWVDRTDHEREQFVKYRLGKEPGDPLSYDLLLNVGRYSTGEAAALIAQAARLLEGQVQAEPVRP